MHSPSHRKPGAEDGTGLARRVFGGASVTNDDPSSPLRACFGVGCPHHHHCARYAAVVDSQASLTTMGTCRRDDTYPLFMEVCAARSILPT
jgi:hypothetical protein